MMFNPLIDQMIATVGQIIAIAILLALLKPARDQYVTENPGQPGWGVYVLGIAAIFILLIT